MLSFSTCLDSSHQTVRVLLEPFHNNPRPSETILSAVDQTLVLPWSGSIGLNRTPNELIEPESGNTGYGDKSTVVVAPGRGFYSPSGRADPHSSQRIVTTCLRWPLRSKTSPFVTTLGRCFGGPLIEANSLKDLPSSMWNTMPAVHNISYSSKATR